MIAVSDAWKDVQYRFLLPESYIEIDCAITDVGAQESASASGDYETAFSDAENILGDAPTVRYATNELNLWSLDGTRRIMPDGANYGHTGYVSDIESTGSVTLSFPEIRTNAIAGVTITWSEKFDEYSPIFTVTAKKGSAVVAETTVTDNTDSTSVVFVEASNYDSIVITVHTWSLPNRRARIERVLVGHMLTITKNDILRFSHEQHGDLLSGELPKYSIEFTLDNTDGRWNPHNPTGMERYLSERQKLTVRYGLDINGTIEWIKAGTFYLSEWDAPSNGFEARFVARDAFDFLLGADLSGSSVSGNLGDLVKWATSPFLPSSAKVVIDDSLYNTAARSLTIDGTAAEVVQKCANASCCILRYDRDGVLYVEKFGNTLSDYKITQALSYSHPELTLAKPLKEVSVDYGGDIQYKFTTAPSGEKQTVTNEFIHSSVYAQPVAEWVSGVLKNRKTVSGDFRPDPRLDLYDVVTVESKYGEITPVVITSIRYDFNGSWRGTYTGRVLEVT